MHLRILLMCVFFICVYTCRLLVVCVYFSASLCVCVCVCVANRSYWLVVKLRSLRVFMSGEAEQLGGIFSSLKQNDSFSLSLSLSLLWQPLLSKETRFPEFIAFPSLSIHSYLTNPYGGLLMTKSIERAPRRAVIDLEVRALWTLVYVSVWESKQIFTQSYSQTNDRLIVLFGCHIRKILQHLKLNLTVLMRQGCSEEWNSSEDKIH